MPRTCAAHQPCTRLGPEREMEMCARASGIVFHRFLTQAGDTTSLQMALNGALTTLILLLQQPDGTELPRSTNQTGAAHGE